MRLLLTNVNSQMFGLNRIGTRTVRGSDYSPAIALSEDKDIFSNCDATLQKNDPLQSQHRSCQ